MISCKAVIKDIDIKIIPSTLSSNFFELSFRGIRLSLSLSILFSANFLRTGPTVFSRINDSALYICEFLRWRK